jgi:hypothetical protein
MPKLVKNSSCEGSIHDVPSWNKDNEFVVSSYRINHQGLSEIAWSIFKIHNETVNVWSHFLGKLMFITAGIVIFFSYPNMHNLGQTGMVEYYQNYDDMSLERFTLEKISQV